MSNATTTVSKGIPDNATYEVAVSLLQSGQATAEQFGQWNAKQVKAAADAAYQQGQREAATKPDPSEFTIKLAKTGTGLISCFGGDSGHAPNSVGSIRAPLILAILENAPKVVGFLADHVGKVVAGKGTYKDRQTGESKEFDTYRAGKLQVTKNTAAGLEARIAALLDTIGDGSEGGAK